MNKYMVKKIIKKIILIAIIVVGVYYGKQYYDQNMKKVFKPEEYKTAIEINSNADFMLLINQNNKVTDVIYLNESSVETLKKARIENRNIGDAIELVINTLASNRDAGVGRNIIITNYGDVNIYNMIMGEISKDLVVYDIDIPVERRENTIENKVRELNLSIGDNTGNLWALYNYSSELKKKK